MVPDGRTTGGAEPLRVGWSEGSAALTIDGRPTRVEAPVVGLVVWPGRALAVAILDGERGRRLRLVGPDGREPAVVETPLGWEPSYLELDGDRVTVACWGSAVGGPWTDARFAIPPDGGALVAIGPAR